METLRSYVGGAWYEAKSDFVTLHDPSTEQPIARASTAGLDFAGALAFARDFGGTALRDLTFAERGAMLKAMSNALHARRDALIEASLVNGGSTRKDGKFDVDGAIGTLSFYGTLGESLGSRRILVDGEGVQLGRTARFWGQHVFLPRPGVALHVNAFNFPAWGFAEKAACALLAGMPVVTKPATSTALVTARCVDLCLAAGVLPDGALSFLAGSTGDLLDRLGPHDVLAFTGSASTAMKLRSRANVLARSVRVNIEADSLNAAVLAPDVAPGSETWNLFFRDVELEMTQKTGQKCTAVRRIFVPAKRADDVRTELADRLRRVVTGHPSDSTVTMGPLATADQLADAISGVKKLRASAELVQGTGERAEGAGAPSGKGWYFPPVLLWAADARSARPVHEHEVFGPVATLMPYGGGPAEAAELCALAEGTLVSSVYSDDEDWVGELLLQGGSWSGRWYLGSEKMAGQALGSGTALPQSLHGGPGRAGGGEELGGLRGAALYMQRVALQGSKPMVEHIAPAK